MNSKSKCYYNDGNSTNYSYNPKSCNNDDTNESTSCPVVIKCSSPSGTATITAAAAAAAVTSTTISTLNLNTSCLDNPCTAIDFTASVTPSTGFVGTISFQLFKTSICLPNATPVAVGAPFIYSVPVALATPLSTTITLSSCDCDNCVCNCNCNCNCNNNCYSYSVVATTIVTTGATGTATVASGVIRTISTCSSSCGC